MTTNRLIDSRVVGICQIDTSLACSSELLSLVAVWIVEHFGQALESGKAFEDCGFGNLSQRQLLCPCQVNYFLMAVSFEGTTCLVRVVIHLGQGGLHEGCGEYKAHKILSKY